MQLEAVDQASQLALERSRPEDSIVDGDSTRPCLRDRTQAEVEALLGDETPDADDPPRSIAESNLFGLQRSKHLHVHTHVVHSHASRRRSQAPQVLLTAAT